MCSGCISLSLEECRGNQSNNSRVIWCRKEQNLVHEVLSFLQGRLFIVPFSSSSPDYLFSSECHIVNIFPPSKPAFSPKLKTRRNTQSKLLEFSMFSVLCMGSCQFRKKIIVIISKQASKPFFLACKYSTILRKQSGFS